MLGHHSAGGTSPDTPVFVISVAARLAGMHPQTLRQYDRLGLVSPRRTPGRGRRYSLRDVATLREVQRLSQEGVSLAGIQRIMELEAQVKELQERLAALAAQNAALQEAVHGQSRVFAAGPSGDVVVLRPGTRPRPSGVSQELVLWRPRQR